MGFLPRYLFSDRNVRHEAAYVSMIGLGVIADAELSEPVLRTLDGNFLELRKGEVRIAPIQRARIADRGAKEKPGRSWEGDLRGRPA
jgi:hypothetical protein